MHSNTSKKYLIPALLFYAGIIFICGCQEKKLYRQERLMLGTFVEVISPEKEAANIAFNEIKRIEDYLSKYNPQSEVARLNRLGRLKVSPETFYILKKAQEFYLATNGAFDISVGPLMDLWGFTDKRYNLPKPEEIAKALKLTGADKIILQDFDNVVQFKLPGMKIDLGAIAKGYALDCAVKKIKASGIKSCLINAGGQIHCLGGNSFRPWRVALSDPRGPKVSAYLELKDQAVATSGDYAQYFLKDKRHYGHIFDPRTGYPVESKIISVTVISKDGLDADALATAIFVLGKDKGEKLAKQFKCTQVKIIEKYE